MTPPTRIDGYAPIRDYAAIGNRRTAALVARDGSIDWLCLPRLDSPSVFGALLDSRSGGSFSLAPEAPFDVERRYLSETNVLETTFITAEGSVRVTDAMNVREDGPMPWNELVRRVEGVWGEVALRWRLAPRFDYGRARGAVERSRGVPIVRQGLDSLVLESFDAGEAQVESDGLSGRFAVGEGASALLALCGFHDQPLLFSSREEYEERLDVTIEFWRRRARRCEYDGPWRDAVVRSSLALDLLFDATTSAMAGAATMGLPERIGGDANFDYRYAWLRDGNLALDAQLRLGYREQVHASLGWMLRTTKRTHPRLRPFYQLDGTAHVEVEELPLAGYRDSQPVLLGNGAGGQLQLGNFGDLMETAWLYVRDGNALDSAAARRLAELADFVCEVWDDEDAGIWELGTQHHYTQSKIACWIALDRACRIAEAGQLPDEHRGRWAETAHAIRTFVEERCWSEERNSYMRFADSDDQFDAALLLSTRAEYDDPTGPRMNGTIDALRAELGRGPLLYRYSGMDEREGCFLACCFWLVEALARAGRLEESAEAMEELLSLSNDVGLFSEEIDPDSHELLGNFPQALSHLALINAACQYVERRHAGAEHGPADRE